MRPGAVVLVSGPVDGPADAVGLCDPTAGDADGYDVLSPPSASGGQPYAVTWIASIARPLHAHRLRDPLVLVGHGTAGPLLPALARTQRAAGRRIGGYVFVDATLPRPGSPSHLDLLRAADAEQAERAHEALHEHDATWPPGAPRPQGHDFWTEPLPPAPDWPDAPCAYVRTRDTAPGTGPVEFWARSARSRGWPVREGSDPGRMVREVVEGLPG